MPALPNVPSVLRCALSGQIGTITPWLSRFYVSYSGTAPTNTQLATFNGAVEAAYVADLKALVDTADSLTQIETVDLTSPTAAGATNGYNVVGTRAGSPNPAQIATVVSYEIGRRYRGGHPRGYWRFGVNGDLNTSRVWTSAFQTAVNSGIGSFFAAVVAAGWSGAGTLAQVNVSYYSGFTVVTSPTTGRARNVPKLRVGGPITDPITSYNTRLYVGTQRRREEFLG